MKQFLNESYTAYHTTANVCKILKDNGFVQLQLGEPWKLVPGGSYYLTQNGSSFVAFKLGKNKVYNLCVSHTDSPSYKVKGGCVLPNNGMQRLNTERYGGALNYTYFDRPMKIAGRLLCKTPNGLEQVLVVSPYNVVIPSVASHISPGINEGFAPNLQNDTLPLFSQNQTDLYKTLTDKTVVDADLFVVPATPAFSAGVDGEFICSPRIDNLTSVFASVNALCACTPKDIAMVAALDNEEIGSTSRQGNPNFIATVLEQLESTLGFTVQQKIAARQNGLVVSVDNIHSVHPAHPERSDPKMFPFMNGGVVVKHHANYATDGLSSAIFKRILQNSDVPCQDCYNRSDNRCGLTVGLKTAAALNIKTCDIGIAQLAMHSACETMGAKDVDYMQKALTLFLETALQDDGTQVSVG